MERLTTLSHLSSPFLATFLAVHLSAPLLSNVGGSSLASQTLLLGREYYQTSFGEKYLLAVPFAVHATAGIAKRLLALYHHQPRLRPATHLLSTTAYAALFFFLPIHVLTHRTYPTNPTPPTLAVGPAELDFEFVKFGLRTWPVRSWLLYTGLVGCVLLHAAEGARVILRRVWFFSKPSPSRSGVANRRTFWSVGAALGGAVLSGVFLMSREPLMIFASLSQRYSAAFSQSLFYRI